jgi:hypothetical protein
MERMPENVDHGELNKGTLKTITRLLLHVPTKPLSGPLLLQLEAVDVARIAANKASNVRIIAEYTVLFWQEQIVEVISSLELDAERVVNRNLKLAPYTDLFEEFNVQAHREMEPKELEDEVTNKIDVIKELPRDSILRPHVPALEALVQQWKAPRAELKKAVAADEKAQKALAKERTKLANLLVSTHGGLEKIYPERKKTVEAFFYRWSTKDQTTSRKGKKGKKKGKNGGTETTPPPAPTA